MNLFERLRWGQPPAVEAEIKQPQKDAELLLGFLQRWPRPVISSRDVRIWGPKKIRDRESAIRAAQILAAHGRLVPVGDRVWKIVREPLTPPGSP
jgi:hypothetical protein